MPSEMIKAGPNRLKPPSFAEYPVDGGVFE